MITSRPLWPALLGLLVWIASPLAVGAHAELLGSEPAAGASLDESPQWIRLWFTEPVVAGFTEARILDSRGRSIAASPSQIEAGDMSVVLRPLPELQPGVYTVSWRALSAIDGHIDRGMVVFALGREPGQITAADDSLSARPELWLGSLVRWLSYVATAVLLGSAALHLAISWSARKGAVHSTLSQADRRRLRQLVTAGAAVLVTATIGDLMIHSVTTAEASPGGVAGAAEGLIMRTRFGAIWIGRIVLAIALARVIHHALESDQRGADRWGAAAFMGGLLLFTFAAMSHAAATTNGGWLGIVLSWLHLTAVSVWVGGLAALAAMRDGRATALPIFSSFAVIAVALLVGSGVVQALMLGGSASAIVETAYGRTLLLKLIVVAGVLLLAFVNRRSLHRWLAGNPGPRTTAAAAASVPGPAVRFGPELAAVGVALGVTAVLAGLPPAWQVYQQAVRSRPLETTVQVSGQTWILRLVPGRPGSNQVTARPPAGVSFDSARLQLTPIETDLPTSAMLLDQIGDGVWGGVAQLGVTGRWQAEAVFRPATGGDVLIRFAFDLPGPATALPPAPILSGGAPSATAVAALGLAALGVALMLFVIRTTGLGSWEGRGLTAATVAITLLGAYVAVRPQPSDAVVALNARATSSPIEATEESVARGATIYSDSCATCHGSSGAGDGSSVTARGQRLTDLRVHLTAGHSDGDIFYWISRGIAGTDMPAFGETLGESDRWHVVNYLRTLTAAP